MTDSKLRELERRWKETGSPEDQEAYLVERVRAGEALEWDSYSRLSELNVEAAAEYLRGRVERGELTQERLELAAYCGDGGAASCCALTVPLEFEKWAERLQSQISSFPKAMEIEFQLGLANHLLDGWGLEGATYRTTLESVEQWLECPSEARSAACMDCLRTALSAAPGHLEAEQEASLILLPAAMVSDDQVFRQLARRFLGFGAMVSRGAANFCLLNPGGTIAVLLSTAAKRRSEGAVREAIRIVMIRRVLHGAAGQSVDQPGSTSTPST